jgi:hypothetical protein
MTSCAYIGNQQRLDSLAKLNDNYWWQINWIGRYNFNDKTSLSVRLEYFDDPKSVQITALGSADPFKAYSASICFNWKVHSNAVFRIEGRQFYSEEEVFISENSPSQTMTWGIASIAAWF